MTLDDLTKQYGSEIMVAANLGFSHQSVKNWAAAGAIPYETQCVIQVKTNGQFLAREEIHLITEANND